MTDDNYRRTLEIAKDELESLLDEEATLDSTLANVRLRIEALRKTVVTLSDLLGEDREPASVGITDAIRGVLKSQMDMYFGPIGVRSKLQTANFPLGEYKNVLAVIHTTLKRLEEQGEVRVMTREGKNYYQWIKKADEGFPF